MRILVALFGFFLSIDVYTQTTNFSYGYIGETPKYLMSVSEIINYDSICVFSCGLLPSDYTIVGFSLSYVFNGSRTKEYSHSAQITEKQKEIITKHSGGYKMSFEDIKIKLKTNDSIINVNSFSIRIIAPATYGVINLKDHTQIYDSNNSYEIKVLDEMIKLDSIIVSNGFVSNEHHIGFDVLSFSMDVNNSIYHSDDNIVTKEMKESISRLKKNKLLRLYKVSITDVKYRNNDGNYYYASPLHFTVFNKSGKKFMRISKRDYK